MSDLKEQKANQNPQYWTSPSFYRVFLFSLLSALLFSVVLNILVNPYGVYGVELVPRVEINNYEKKLELIEKFQPPPKALIIGSSRVMSFDPEIVEEILGKRCFNFSVGARAESYYAVLRLALEKYNAPLDTVIVQVEPEVFHPSLPADPQARFEPEYSQYFIYGPKGATLLEKIALLITLEQVGESIDSIFRLIRKETDKQKIAYKENGFSIQIQREADIKNNRFNLDAIIDKRLRRYPERSFLLSKFTGLSETRKKYWQDFLDICRERNIKVYACMPPVHPRLLELLYGLGAERIFKETEKYLKETVSEKDWVFKNYTNIETFNGDAQLFYDEIHMQPENCNKLLRDLLSSDNAERIYNQ